MSKRAWISFFRATLYAAVLKEKNIFQLKPQGFVSLRKSGTSWTMPLHTETLLRQLYSHARSHINRSCLRLQRLLTISRFSALRLDGAVLVAASVLNRSGMIPFAVFYLSSDVFSYSRHDDPWPHHYYYQYVRHFQNFRSIESRGRFDSHFIKKKKKKLKEPNRFYNQILFWCNYIYRSMKIYYNVY